MTTKTKTKAPKTASQLKATASATISFGLVTVPVKFYSPIEDKKVHYNQIHKGCGDKLSQGRMVCPTHGEVERDEIEAGYPVTTPAGTTYVTLTEEEKIEVESTKVLAVETFVPQVTVDPIYYETTYYLGPDVGGETAFGLLSAGLNATKTVAIGNLTMKGKSTVALIRPFGFGLVLHQLRYFDTVRDYNLVGIREYPGVGSKEVQLASLIIEQAATPAFLPEKYKDEVRDKMLALIESKAAGTPIKATPTPGGAAPTTAMDLVALLQASLDAAKAQKEVK